MEDHLNNRDRMDKEWASLCAYEADPCSTSVAEKVKIPHFIYYWAREKVFSSGEKKSYLES
jgi:hypothetical protein